ncbi:nuclear transport factor 2 family protein [Ulvibacter antarcticus]|uniref:Putative lumazine-binding protein n=1 Tax=Ulvibacter antarcticus TaxID=442714 RepID=A0A3L9YFW3_9FLAO|nr:nuclear transport factor 2 family protein [Ulvibacter antarcticus]RMA58019.1 putative lumazine-binding protein [Ulvibacter antarcticus]
MKKHILLVLALSTLFFGYAQSDEELAIKATLNNYIHGSSYNEIEQLESAFTEDATLYLVSRDTLKRYSPVEYTNFFKKRVPGEYNGRKGTILEVAVIKDMATAKVEILIEKSNTRYLDIFLLRNIKDSGWKIISKTATIVDD